MRHWMQIVGNWKMYKGPRETEWFCRELRRRLDPLLDEIGIGLCPPFVSIEAARREWPDVPIFAQNAHWERYGAFTGEVSAHMLEGMGVRGCLVGHSERRHLFGETDEDVGRRARGGLDAHLQVIACVGELDEERERGETEDVLRRQVSVLEPHERLVIAYEPVWAIGTGKTATPEIAQEAHAFIKSLIDVPVLYGGSVKPENAEELLRQPDVNGALVGGASLELDSFAAICEAALRTRS
jgi:triosephosphate isomerase (TIM)